MPQVHQNKMLDTCISKLLFVKEEIKINISNRARLKADEVHKNWYSWDHERQDNELGEQVRLEREAEDNLSSSSDSNAASIELYKRQRLDSNGRDKIQ